MWIFGFLITTISMAVAMKTGVIHGLIITPLLALYKSPRTYDVEFCVSQVVSIQTLHMPQDEICFKFGFLSSKKQLLLEPMLPKSSEE